MNSALLHSNLKPLHKNLQGITMFLSEHITLYSPTSNLSNRSNFTPTRHRSPSCLNPFCHIFLYWVLNILQTHINSTVNKTLQPISLRLFSRQLRSTKGSCRALRYPSMPYFILTVLRSITTRYPCNLQTIISLSLHYIPNIHSLS